MNSTERVSNTILGKSTDRQPIYGWVSANLSGEISQVYGSVETFEDPYEFDMAHLFGGPDAFRRDVLEQVRLKVEEITPDLPEEEPAVLAPPVTLTQQDVRMVQLSKSALFLGKRILRRATVPGLPAEDLFIGGTPL